MPEAVDAQRGMRRTETDCEHNIGSGLEGGGREGMGSVHPWRDAPPDDDANASSPTNSQEISSPILLCSLYPKNHNHHQPIQ